MVQNITEKKDSKKKNLIKSRLEENISLESCLRAWEPYQKKGYDHNETRITDILTCWAGEEGPSLGIIGIPFDSAVIGRKGAKGGPKKIRDSIRYFKAYDWENDFWFGNKEIFDFGDVIFESESVLESHNQISNILKKIASRNFVVITLGGDHSISYPLVEGMKAAYGGKIGLVNIDAHLDVREVIDGRISSGTPFRRLLDNGIINGSNFVEIGIRNFANARIYRQYVEDQKGTIYTVDDIRNQGLDDIISETIKKITKNTDYTYISLDIDSLDQIFAPGVSAPTPDGLNPYQINQIIKRIVSETNVIGMDIVELNPIYDTADTTAINAANFLVQFVASYFRKETAQK